MNLPQRRSKFFICALASRPRLDRQPQSLILVRLRNHMEVDMEDMLECQSTIVLCTMVSLLSGPMIGDL
jgi:hypothetical protein